MKKIVLFGLLLIVGSFVLSFLSKNDFLGIRRYYYYSACSAPIGYQLGRIDPRFGLSRTEVMDATNQAANIWNTAMNSRIFSYTPGAKLTVNMVYDRRQSLQTQINQREDDLKSGKTTLEAETESFKRRAAAFDKRLTAFNAKVEYWNGKGGAPRQEFDNLIQEQQAINNEAQSLNLISSKLNLSTDQYNIKVGTFNQTIRSFKNELKIRPEEGIYDPREEKIDIFFNNNRDELVRTIAHELGHSRGLKHSVNPHAIMYPSTTKTLSTTDDEVSALKYICRNRAFYEVWSENLVTYFKLFRDSL